MSSSTTAGNRRRVADRPSTGHPGVLRMRAECHSGSHPAPTRPTDPVTPGRQPSQTVEFDQQLTPEHITRFNEPRSPMVVRHAARSSDSYPPPSPIRSATTTLPLSIWCVTQDSKPPAQRTKWASHASATSWHFLASRLWTGRRTNSGGDCVFCDGERERNDRFRSTLIGTRWPTHREIE